MARRPIDLRSTHGAGETLEVYVLYIEDGRYSVPTLDTVTVANDALAREVAIQRVAASKFYRQVEIWQDDRLVDTIANPGWPGAL